MEGSRTTLILAGLACAFIWQFTGWLILAIVGVVLVLIGCYQWTKLKNRHWAFMFWGLLAPIGLLGISLLQDKSWSEVHPADRSSSYQPPPSARGRDLIDR